MIVPAENISSLNVAINASIEDERNGTPNTPIVNITSPSGGETFLDPFNITWSASDADNDSMLYVVLISDDNGSSWLTLDFDLNQTYYQVDNADFLYGESYRVRVLATDGFNTGTATLNVSFTIVPPPSVAASPIEELDSLGANKVFEGIITNDGGQTLNATQWRFDTGLVNITSTSSAVLEQNEELFLILAEEYASGGAMTIELFAHDDNAEVNDSITTDIFVGDLRTGNITQVITNSTQRTFQFAIWNADEGNLTDINWTFDTGESNITSSTPINLTANNATYINVSHNYSDTGYYLVTITADDGFSAYSDTLDFTIPDITIEELEVVHQEDENIIYTFSLLNELNTGMNASWTLNTGSETIASNEDAALESQERVFAIVEADFTTFGDFTSVLNATDGSHERQASVDVSVKELETTLTHLDTTGTVVIYELAITNSFSINKTIDWTFNTNSTAANATSDTSMALIPDGYVPVIIAQNLTASGTYSIAATAETPAANYTEETTVTV